MPPDRIVIEDGTVQTVVSTSIIVIRFTIPLVIRAQSDIETVVPEPSTLLLVPA